MPLVGSTNGLDDGVVRPRWSRGSFGGVNDSSQPLSPMHDDADHGLGAERPAQPVGGRRRQVVGPGEAGLGDLAGGEPDEQHHRHEHRLQQQDPAVRRR